ncbi:MAG: phosphate acyltransferase PlsX [Planctomycetota bacterium]
MSTGKPDQVTAGEAGAVRIAVDAMGGDDAPDAIVRGCLAASDVLGPDDRLLVIGDESVIREICEESSGAIDPRMEIVHASDVIEMGESPAKAVRGKPDSSIVKMTLLGSQKAEGPLKADVVLSAGNTGACVTAGIMHMKRLRGVHRPAIAATIPSFDHNVVLCDAGANPEPKPVHLWQYGVMSEVYAKHVHGIPEPRIALMNIGSEEGKGSEMIRQTRDMLRATPGLNFVGYIEGREFFENVADVIITDGFVGNTVLKTAEGLAKSLFKAIGHEILTTAPELAAGFEPVAKQIYAKNDYHELGGAPLLGVNGSYVIAHGSSQPRTIRASIRNARKLIQYRLNDHILDRLAQVAHIEDEVSQQAKPQPA